ncbi:benzoate 4-monooxygenase cytochrome P450 [Coprinopsis sp. MPI-PUGE-AT-0042]|nr:benzoate 4-monooxygenase cytochrome P450 [Coprinopsis sp. MPI-PUGE-AT-0042]
MNVCVCGWLALILLGCLYLVVQRLMFHPLASIPGPTLAALTPFYKTYYEVVQGGKWLRHLKSLHDAYGSVVRVGPNEVHFDDPRAFNRIFSLGSHLTKDPGFYACFGVNASTFGSTDAVEAKARREVLSPFFEKRSITELEDVIRSNVDLLVERLATSPTPMDVFYGFRCAAMDIISTYCFGRSPRMLHTPEFKAPVILDIQQAIPLLWTIKSFPWITRLLPWLPDTIGGRLKRQYDAFMRVRTFVCQESRYAVSGNGSPREEKAPARAIFHHLGAMLSGVDSPEHQTRLLHEGLSLIQAGSDPVANTCVVGLFHILRNPSIHKRLANDLVKAFPDPSMMIAWAELKKISYLTAVIKEALRLSHGFVSPMLRVVGEGGIELSGYDIPAGTSVGMSVTFMHMNETVFSHPDKFWPERWLESTPHLVKYLVPFSKGPRMCPGVNMAWAELYLTIGTLVRRLEMNIVDTSETDIAEFDEVFIPVYTGRHLHIKAKRRAKPGPTVSSCS